VLIHSSVVAEVDNGERSALFGSALIKKQVIAEKLDDWN
jgi:hypothetical protein